MRTLGVAAVLIVLVVAFSACAMAQGVASADLHGTVKDPAGAAVSGANVTVRDDAKNIVRSTKTTAVGDYTLSSLPPGQYVLTVEAPGFSKVTAKNVKLTVGQSAELPIALKLASAEQVVTVDAEAQLVETQRSSASTTVTQERIDNLPINGRNYINFTLTN